MKFGLQQSFFRQRGLLHLSEEQHIDHIENQLGMIAVQDKRGQWRVEIPDQNDDEIKVKRGTREYCERTKNHNYKPQDKDLADQHFESKQDKLRLRGGYVKEASYLNHQLSK